MATSGLRRHTPASLVRIHPTARVDPMAVLGAGVEVAPYAIVEAGARIGNGTVIMAHAFISGSTDIGPDAEIHIGAILGHTPQIRGFSGGGSLRLGARTIVREHATVHRASVAGAETVIGADVMLLANSHVAHDCHVGNGVTIANGALLAGFVTLGDRAFISGNVVVHQHVRIGELAIVGGNARVSKDVPPFMMAVGDTRVRGLNVVGMRRASMSPEARQRVRTAYGLLYRSGLNIRDAVARLRELPPSAEIDAITRFVETSVRGVCGGPRRRRD
jgi:UDP-N-acetylglucosamine acyltransferase